jgi:hypothetical protein
VNPNELLIQILMNLADGEDPSAPVRYMAPTPDPTLPGVAFFEAHLNSPDGKLEERFGVTICVGRIE